MRSVIQMIPPCLPKMYFPYTVDVVALRPYIVGRLVREARGDASQYQVPLLLCRLSKKLLRLGVIMILLLPCAVCPSFRRCPVHWPTLL